MTSDKRCFHKNLVLIGSEKMYLNKCLGSVFSFTPITQFISHKGTQYQEGGLRSRWSCKLTYGDRKQICGCLGLRWNARWLERGMRSLEVIGNALHLDCGGGDMDSLQMQFIVHTVYVYQVDSKRKKSNQDRDVLLSWGRISYRSIVRYLRSPAPHQLHNKEILNTM